MVFLSYLKTDFGYKIISEVCFLISYLHNILDTALFQNVKFKKDFI